MSKKYRFKVGDEILARVNKGKNRKSEWERGRITLLDWVDMYGDVHPYQFEISEVFLYAPEDTNNTIRQYFDSPLEQIKLCIECNDDDELERLVEKYPMIDYTLPAVYSDIWLHIAKHGNNWMAEYLWDRKIVREGKCGIERGNKWPDNVFDGQV